MRYISKYHSYLHDLIVIWLPFPTSRLVKLLLRLSTVCVDMETVGLLLLLLSCCRVWHNCVNNRSATVSMELIFLDRKGKLKSDITNRSWYDTYLSTFIVCIVVPPIDIVTWGNKDFAFRKITRHHINIHFNEMKKWIWYVDSLRTCKPFSHFVGERDAISGNFSRFHDRRQTSKSLSVVWVILNEVRTQFATSWIIRHSCHTSAWVAAG